MASDRRSIVRLTGIGLAGVLAGCTGDAGSGDRGASIERTTEVSMENTQFQPRNVSADAGATVTWTNRDDSVHTVTSASDNWSKDTEVAGGEQAAHTFEQDGVYDVYCRNHGSADLSGMSMKVGVGDATIEDPLGGGGSDGGGAYG